MKLVRTGAGNNIGGGTGAVAKFGGSRVGENTEFADGVDGWFKDEAAVNAVIVLHTVDKRIDWTPAAGRSMEISLHRPQRATGVLESPVTGATPGCNLIPVG